ncbi:MAG: hemerythrin domain-containing protein [Mycobacterium sp.]
MPDETLSAALEHEHREIDDGIEAFIKDFDGRNVQLEPLVAGLDALRRHIYLEEVFLFPPIREAGLVMPIFVMMREHGELWRIMDAVLDLVAARNDTEKLLVTCRELLYRLGQHNSKEEPVIYPHADTDLPAPTGVELSQFIETGRMPDGWVCQQASADAAG